MRRLFPSQLEDEQIYLIVREHWVLLVLKLVVWFLFALVIFVVRHYGPQVAPQLFTGTAGVAVSLFLDIYGLLLLLALLIIWELYYLNIQIITNLRVVDIDQQGLFSHTVSELHIENIEDVTSKTAGLLGTMFNFGQVYVQTAGTVERFIFESIPNPAGIERLVLDLYEKLPKKPDHPAATAATINKS